jgi:hypothetical protein
MPGKAAKPAGQQNRIVTMEIEPKTEVKSTPLVSIFLGVGGGQASDISAAEVIEDIATGAFKGPVGAVRQLYNETLQKTRDPRKAKDAVRSLKNNLLAAVWSGTFDGRGDKNLLAYSHLLCGDLDDVPQSRMAEIRATFDADPHCRSVFISPTGTGFKVLFAVAGDSRRHLGNFYAVQAHVKKLTGLDIDKACKNVERLCFVSDDPDAEWKAEAVPLQPIAEPIEEPEKPKAAISKKPKPPSKSQKSKPPISEKLLMELLQHIPPEDYDTWRKVCGAIKIWGEQIGDDTLAYDIAAEWSRESKKYDDGEQEKTWDALERDANAPNVAGIGTIFWLAKQGGWEPTTTEQVKKEQGRGLLWDDVEPWPEPVNGEKLLGELLDTFPSFLIMRPEEHYACSFWTMHSYVYDVGEYSPILSVRSPERECGKSRLLDLLAKLVNKPLLTAGVSGAALYRSVEAWRPSLLIDEYDSQAGASEELAEAIRNVLNSGFQRSGASLRCVGANWEPKQFSTFCPKVVAAIGSLPDTAASRAITITLSRKLPSEKVERLRNFDGMELRRKLVRWAADNRETLASARPKLPECLGDREMDIWEPLIAVADLCGYGEAARKVAILLCKREDKDSLGVELLRDCRKAFSAMGGPEERLRSEVLLQRLNDQTDRPWATLCNGKPLHAHRLAKMLAGFGVAPCAVDKARRNGYCLSHFADAFTRYLPAEEKEKENGEIDP